MAGDQVLTFSVLWNECGRRVHIASRREAERCRSVEEVMRHGEDKKIAVVGSVVLTPGMCVHTQHLGSLCVRCQVLFVPLGSAIVVGLQLQQQLCTFPTGS